MDGLYTPEGVRRSAFQKPVTQRTRAELYGLVQGVLADGLICENEAKTLHAWIASNESTRNYWPASVLFVRIEAMLEDGVLSEDEQRELLRVLAEYMDRQERGHVPMEPGVVMTSEMPKVTCASPYDDPQAEIEFEFRRFVVTGEFAFGSRGEVMGEIECRDGIVSANVSKSTNYVIVGSLGSDAWIADNWGTKIERAVALRAAGIPVRIMTEEHWVGCIGRCARSRAW